MLSFVLAVLLFTSNSSGDPVDPETCAFLPADDPCHYPPFIPPDLCFENGQWFICPPG